MKNILIISFSFLKNDPRIQRQIDTLKGSYNISVLGFGPSGHSEVIEYQISPPQKRKNKYKDALLLLGRFFGSYYNSLTYVVESRLVLKGKTFDFVIANDIESLPLALDFSPEAKIWFDAHEYSPREFEDSFQWKIFFGPYKTYLCRKYLSAAETMTTVCDGIAKEYSKEFSLNKVGVIRNSPNFYDLAPSQAEAGSIKFVHHGAAIRGRKIENMIQLMKHLDERFHLYLMLVPTDPDYLEELRKLSSEGGRVTFLSPVPMKDIPAFINKFDLGIYFLEPINFNQKFALPNKIFEFVQARLGIVIGPSIEMAKIVKENNLGIVTDSFSVKEIAVKINALSVDQIQYFKENAHNSAEKLSFKNDSRAILKIAEEALNSSR